MSTKFDLTFIEDNLSICIKSLKGGHTLWASGKEQCLKTTEELKMEKKNPAKYKYYSSIHSLIHSAIFLSLVIQKYANRPSPWLKGWRNKQSNSQVQ